MLLAPLLSFTLVEYLNYNNPWTDFTALQIALNLAWYYLGELFFYFVLRRRASAVKWAMGIAWGLGMANHYLISFRGRTLFPGDFLTLRTAANVAGNYDYRPDSMQWLTIGVFAASRAQLSFLPNEKKRPFPWRLFVPAARGSRRWSFWACFGTEFVRARHWANPGRPGATWPVHNFSVCLKVHEVGSRELLGGGHR